MARHAGAVDFQRFAGLGKKAKHVQVFLANR
jgi:hypothetical protein